MTGRTQHPSAAVGKEGQIGRYLELFRTNDDEGVLTRKRHYADVSALYYTLGSRLYELGWGRSFHFCPFKKGETLAVGLRRRERYISDRLGLQRGMVVLDAGCGVGGPMREIARHSGARVVGVTIVSQQVEMARRYNERAGLSQQCEVMPRRRTHFFRRLVGRHGSEPWKIVTDKLGRYRVAHRELRRRAFASWILATAA